MVLLKNMHTGKNIVTAFCGEFQARIAAVQTTGGRGDGNCPKPFPQGLLTHRQSARHVPMVKFILNF